MKEMEGDIHEEERHVRSYARSHLKQRYDEVVVDESRGIGGYLWKFPSEGSNNSTASVHAAPSRHELLLFPTNAFRGDDKGDEQDAAYPRKCMKCQIAWVSDRAADKQHQKRCGAASHRKKKQHTRQSDAATGGGDGSSSGVDAQQEVRRLGTARRVWCEVDGSLSRLQVRSLESRC